MPELVEPKKSNYEAAVGARPPIKLFRFKETFPVQWHENKIGATHRPWWFYDVREVASVKVV